MQDNNETQTMDQAPLTLAELTHVAGGGAKEAVTAIASVPTAVGGALGGALGDAKK